MELSKSPVQFDSLSHTYYLGNQELHGVTTMLSHQLFQDKYKGIPESVLQQAQERGTFIHECCELVDTMKVNINCVEAENYLRLCKDNGLKIEASEYLISDEEYFASAIDKVYRVNARTFDIADIKTTSKLDIDYVRWQLSVYAYMFEAQNPRAKVRNLYAIWLRGDIAELVPVERIEVKVIKELMLCEREGRQFINPFALTISDTLPAKYVEIEDAIAEIDMQLKYWTDKKKQLTTEVNDQMSNAGAYKWEGGKIAFLRKDGYIREDFDKDAFKAEYPELYKQYIKQTVVKGSVQIKVK